MKYLITIGISLAVSIAVFIGFNSLLPPIEPLYEVNGNLGSTITTINATDTIRGSRTIINDNFSALNTGKLELSDWYATTSATQIVKLGTITSGTWNGSTLTVGYGGTGSTSLASNQILLGNGTGAITNVIGYGVAGQLLTSNGDGNKPTWQSASFDTTGNYKVTGNWTFKGNIGMDNATSAAITLTATTTNFMGVMSRGEVDNRFLQYDSGYDRFSNDNYYKINHKLSGAPKFARITTTQDFGTYAVDCTTFASSTGVAATPLYYQTVCGNVDGSGLSAATTTNLTYNSGAAMTVATTSHWTSSTFNIGFDEQGGTVVTGLLWEIWR